MSASIFEDFLEHSHQAALALAEDSDVLQVTRLPVRGVGTWIAEFAISYLSQGPDGSVRLAAGPIGVMIQMTPEYLRQVSPLEVVQVREMDLFHPNFLWPVLCVGEVRPGMPLPQILRHVYEILTYENYATDDGLNPIACRRLCEQPGLLNLLPRPPRLVRRPLELI